jgi:hypothetical protein
VLRAYVPDAFRRWPELVEAHRVELLYTIPELSADIGPEPETLVGSTPYEERTRYFGRSGSAACLRASFRSCSSMGGD